MALLIDLSHPIEAGMTTYPGLPGPTLRTHLSREESRNRYDPGTEFHIGTIEMVANTGTYLDTPFHRFPEGYDIAGLSLESCADLEGLCVRTDQPRIGPDLLADLDVEGRAVLFHTGWDVHWRTERYGAAEHPHLSAEAADLLVERAAALVGIDSVNIDDTRPSIRPAHSTLLAAGIPIVEHLTGLDAVPESFRFFAVPAPVRLIGTFPVRAFALVG
ncbi:MAG TPA: cyclase family protein [Acidimicrobiia bacterium]|nr:cyclase family protein [Acidimicrobiia bacterium]